MKIDVRIYINTDILNTATVMQVRKIHVPMPTPFLNVYLKRSGLKAIRTNVFSNYTIETVSEK